MSAQPQQISPQEAEHGSLARWMSFTDRVEANIHRMVADVLRHERVVMGEDGENAYVACTHSMHGGPGHWLERQPWPCPDLLHATQALGIDISSTIEAQRHLDEAAYGPVLEPAERLQRWADTLPEGMRDIVLRHHKLD